MIPCVKKVDIFVGLRNEHQFLMSPKHSTVYITCYPLIYLWIPCETVVIHHPFTYLILAHWLIEILIFSGLWTSLCSSVSESMLCFKVLCCAHYRLLLFLKVLLTYTLRIMSCVVCFLVYFGSYI